MEQHDARTLRRENVLTLLRTISECLGPATERPIGPLISGEMLVRSHPAVELLDEFVDALHMAAMIDPPRVLSAEPTAVTPHGGICGGESQQWLSYPTNLHDHLPGCPTSSPLVDPEVEISTEARQIHRWTHTRMGLTRL